MRNQVVNEGHDMVKVKVCGITNMSDALMCVDAGADALGFVFYSKSPRRIPLPEASHIVRSLPVFVTPVAVVVDKDTDLLLRIREAGFCVFQAYFDLTDDVVSLLPGVRFIQACRIFTGVRYAPSKNASAVLVDSYDPENMGGSGKALDWTMAAGLRQETAQPFILAGGLAPDNVAEAIRQVRPYAVDASSRLESEPGRKDAEKVRSFVINAKSAS